MLGEEERGKKANAFLKAKKKKKKGTPPLKKNDLKKKMKSWEIKTKIPKPNRAQRKADELVGSRRKAADRPRS